MEKKKDYRERKVDGKLTEKTNRRQSYLSWSDDFFIKYMKKNKHSWGRSSHLKVHAIRQGAWVLKETNETFLRSLNFNGLENKIEVLNLLTKSVKNLHRNFYIDSVSSKNK